MKKMILYCTAVSLLALSACTKTAPLTTKDNQAVTSLAQSDINEAAKKQRKGMGAKINGTRWLANGLQADSTPLPGAAFYGSFGIDSASLLLVGYGSFVGFENASYAYVLLFVNGFNGTGTYPMGGYNGVNSFGVFTSVYEDGSFDQFYSGENSGILNITSYDQQNQTISGDFNFSAVSSSDSSIIIKNGQFASLQLQ